MTNRDSLTFIRNGVTHTIRVGDIVVGSYDDSGKTPIMIFVEGIPEYSESFRNEDDNDRVIGTYLELWREHIKPIPNWYFDVFVTKNMTII